MKIWHPYSILCISLLFTAVSINNQAAAGATDWVEDLGGRMRVIVAPPNADGEIRAALQVEPNPGFITYWREPGESGIPPQISISGTDGAQLSHIDYPVPKRLQVGDSTDMGYDGPVTFPLTLKAPPGKLPSMSVSAFIGLCKDICIPFQAQFDIPSESAAYAISPIQNAIFAVAASTLPEKQSADFHVINAINVMRALQLDIRFPAVHNNMPEITLANSKGFIVEAPEGVWHDNTYRITIPASEIPKGHSTNGGNWLLLAKTNKRALETPLVFTTKKP